VRYQVPIPFIREKLDSETTRVACCVSGAFFATDGRETNEDGSLLADFTEEVGNG
jgi:hypothetical protein